MANVVNRFQKAERSSYLVPAVALLAVIAFMSLDPLGLASSLRNTVFDWEQRLAPRAAPVGAPQVHLIAIDQESLERLGGWPWPRTRYAELVAATETAGARVVLLDDPVAGPDPTSPSTVAGHLNNFATFDPSLTPRLADYDAQLAQMLAHAHVVLPVAVEPAQGQSGQPLADYWPADAVRTMPSAHPFLPHLTPAGDPIEVVATQVRGVGVNSIRSDADGLVRTLPLAAHMGTGIVPADILETLRLFSGGTPASLGVEGSTDAVGLISRNGITGVDVAGRTVPVTPDGALTFYGRDADGLSRVSAWRILEDANARARLQEGIAVIAVTAPQAADRFITAGGGALTSGEIKALALEQVLDGTHLVRPDWALAAEQLLVLTIGVAMVALVMAGLPVLASLTGLVASGALITAGWMAFTGNGLLIDGALPALGLLAIVLSMGVTSMMAAMRRTSHVLHAVGGKLPTPAVSSLATKSTEHVLTGQLRKITVMFCDVRGYAGFSELHRDDPEWMAYLLQRFHGYVADQIIETGGVADTHHGTAVMGFWNAPVDDPDHARKACDCALKLIEGLEQLNRELELEAEHKSRAFLPLHLAVGVNTGHSLVGNLGSHRQVDYSALGDPVSIARRLQRYSEVYGPAIIVGEHTHNAVKNRYALLELDRIAVEGRDYAVKTYALLGNPVVRANPRFRALEQAQHGILEAYRARNWAATRERIQETRAMKSAIPSLYDFYEQRIRYYEANPPGPDWDGVFRSPVK